jgi:hypothetical protein
MTTKCIYRIKIEQQNDGKIWYTPEIIRPYSKLAKMFGCKDVWLYLGSGVSGTTKTSYETEELAIEQINNHKLNIQKKYDNQIKTINYKQVL